VRALFAENKVRFARAEQLWYMYLQWDAVNQSINVLVTMSDHNNRALQGESRYRGA